MSGTTIAALKEHWTFVRREGLAAWMARLYGDERTRIMLLRWFWFISLAFLLVGLLVILIRLL